MSKPVIMEIENVRIIKYDDLNYTVEREEKSRYYNREGEKWEENLSYRIKGYYGSILACLKAIQRNELLINENAIGRLDDYLKQVKRSNELLLDKLEGLR